MHWVLPGKSLVQYLEGRVDLGGIFQVDRELWIEAGRWGKPQFIYKASYMVTVIHLTVMLAYIS